MRRPGMDVEDQERIARVLKAIANPINLEILALLSAKPSYTREIARMLGRDEADVSRRLKLLEKLNLVRGYWMRLEDRNIRMYEVTARSLRIDFTSQGVVLEDSQGRSTRPPIASIARSIPTPDTFLGRERELEELRSLDYDICIVWGMSGIGKTSLVAAALGDVDNLFWFRFSEMDTLDYLLWKMGLHASSLGEAKLLNALGSLGSTNPGVLDIAVEAMARTRSVIVLDDYHKVEDTRIGSFTRSRLARNAGSYKLIIISRRRPRGMPYHEEGVLEIRLGGLDPGSTRRLAEAILKKPLEPGEAEELYRATGGHPLLVKLLAQGSEGGRGKLLGYLWSEVLRDLSDPEKRIIHRLAAFDEALEPKIISAITGIRDPLPALVRLYNRGLVETVDQGFKVHDTIRPLVPVPDRRTLYERAARALESGGWASRVKAMRYYIKANRPRSAARIVVKRLASLDYTFWPYISSYKEVLESLIPLIDGAPEEPYVLVEASYLVYSIDADPNTASSLVERALERARSLGDDSAVMEALAAYGTLVSEIGRVEEGLDALEEALAIASITGVGPRKLFGIYSRLTMALANTGRIGEAIEVAKLQLETARATGDSYYILSSKSNLGSMLSIAGRLDEAEKILLGVYRDARILGLDSLLIQTLVDLADVYEEKGSLNELKWCLGELDRVSGPRSYRYLEALKNLYRARILELEGRYNEALERAKQALGEAVRIGVQNIEANARLLIARILAGLGSNSEAVEHLRAACRTHGWSGYRLRRDIPKLASRLGVEPGELGECRWLLEGN